MIHPRWMIDYTTCMYTTGYEKFTESVKNTIDFFDNNKGYIMIDKVQVEQIRNKTSSNNVVIDENFKTIFESVNEDINNKGYSQLDGYTFSNDKHHNNQFSVGFEELHMSQTNQSIISELRNYNGDVIQYNNSVMNNDYNSMKMTLNQIWKYVENDDNMKEEAYKKFTEIENYFHELSIKKLSEKNKSNNANKSSGTRIISSEFGDLNQNQYKISRRSGWNKQ